MRPAVAAVAAAFVGNGTDNAPALPRFESTVLFCSSVTASTNAVNSSPSVTLLCIANSNTRSKAAHPLLCTAVAAVVAVVAASSNSSPPLPSPTPPLPPLSGFLNTASAAASITWRTSLWPPLSRRPPPSTRLTGLFLRNSLSERACANVRGMGNAVSATTAAEASTTTKTPAELRSLPSSFSGKATPLPLPLLLPLIGFGK
mmetsp:Transcript_39589/g.72927  ORF Transcript_39589/g.72927 Transcript_39589/m.72927 type:complete len:202 (-) Transcript_39589:681-1286(-)